VCVAVSVVSYTDTATHAEDRLYIKTTNAQRTYNRNKPPEGNTTYNK